LIVADASALIDLLLESEVRTKLEQRLLSGEESLHTPHVVDLEVAHTLRRLVLTGVLSSERAEVALADMADLQLNRYPHVELVPRVWELRDTLTAYDAAYVALAEALEATLVTRDARLARSSGHQARVELL
jgi:predicted nucleic acid-binding protein